MKEKETIGARWAKWATNMARERCRFRTGTIMKGNGFMVTCKGLALIGTIMAMEFRWMYTPVTSKKAYSMESQQEPTRVMMEHLIVAIGILVNVMASASSRGQMALIIEGFGQMMSDMVC